MPLYEATPLNSIMVLLKWSSTCKVFCQENEAELNCEETLIVMTCQCQ